MVKKIIIGTIIIEAIGAILFSIKFVPMMGVVQGIYNGIFHSISAFCNAGFDLMGKYNAYSSFTQYYGDAIINLTIMLLIIIGGIGFIVWDDISRNKLHFHKYMLHTKIVLLATLILVFGGAILFYIFEKDHLMANMSMSEAIWSSLFSSVTARTAGFNTIDTAALSSGSKLLTMILMFIGGSPGSTAGGIKTTTLAVIVLYLWANLRNTYGCNVFNRRLDDDVIKKASLVLYINLFLVIVASITICAIQPLAMDDVLFEVFSAMGTVGMTTGITRELTDVSKLIIILLMYCGRIGSMTFALSLAERKKVPPVKQPIEKITIG